MPNSIETVLVTGGAGYVGAVLVPKLLEKGYSVKVIDLFIFGEDVLSGVENHPQLKQIKGDIRDQEVLAEALKGCDAVIHLACISNDPSFELDPTLGRSINYDAFLPLVLLSKENRIRRFIYASSSSVYGVKKEMNVTENLSLEPLTDYSKYKAMCEEVLFREKEKGFTCVIFRPATACGFSPRMRLDLTVNIMTNAAVNARKITVFGGDQMRPNIHVEDKADLYIQSLQWPDEKIDGKIYNVGYQNHTVMEIAQMVKSIVGDDVEIVSTPTNDNRSYHVSCEKIKKELGYTPKRTIKDAVVGMVNAFQQGRIPHAMSDIRYSNIKVFQALKLK